MADDAQAAADVADVVPEGDAKVSAVESARTRRVHADAPGLSPPLSPASPPPQVVDTYPEAEKLIASGVSGFSRAFVHVLQQQVEGA